MILFFVCETGSEKDAQPVYTNGRTYFNFTGDVCNKNTSEPYNLLIITMCDYSSRVQNPIIFMPYVIKNSNWLISLATSVLNDLYFSLYVFVSSRLTINAPLC